MQVNIPDSYSEQLQSYAAQQGVEVESLVHEAVRDLLEELEDLQEAQEIMARIKAGESKRSPLRDVRVRLERGG